MAAVAWLARRGVSLRTQARSQSPREYSLTHQQKGSVRQTGQPLLQRYRAAVLLSRRDEWYTLVHA
jgi:hypothetical protein